MTEKTPQDYFIAKAFYRAAEALLQEAGEAFKRGQDDVAMYLRQEAQKLEKKANEAWEE